MWRVLSHLVRHCLQCGELPSTINHALLTVVPKQPTVTVMQHVCPLSLCTTIYKAITKFLVTKLHRLLSTLVSSLHSSYILGHNIYENIIITLEILHKFQRSRGSKGFLAWKISPRSMTECNGLLLIMC